MKRKAKERERKKAGRHGREKEREKKMERVEQCYKPEL